MHTNPCLPTENRYTINVWSGMCETGHKSGPETLQGVFQRYLRGQIPSITFCFWFWDILILIIDLSLAQGKVGLFTALRSKYCWTCWAHYFQLSSPFHNKMCFFCWRSLRAQGLSTRRPVISVIKKKTDFFAGHPRRSGEFSRSWARDKLCAGLSQLWIHSTHLHPVRSYSSVT